MRERLLAGEVARRYGVSVDTVRRLAREGTLRAERVGHVRLFGARDAERVFARRRRVRQRERAPVAPEE